MAKVILDAGHGGPEPGAIFEGRQEKDDNLRLALAVGQILEDNGIDVAFTRVEDVYDTPFEKAQIANREGGDFLISFHRNSSPQENQYSGVETLIFNQSGEKVQLANNINAALEEVGFRNLGVRERPGLVILRRSRMPAVLVETGFINTDADNELFDQRFDEVAQAIADGIIETLGQTPEPGRTGTQAGTMQQRMTTGDRGTMQPQMMGGGMGSRMNDVQQRMTSGGEMSMRNGGMMPGMMENQDLSMNQTDPEMEEDIYMEITDAPMPGPSPRPCRCLYRVQTGAFRRREYAEDMLYQLLSRNFPAYILREDDFYKVQVGAFRNLDNAVRMEQVLRNAGYSTFITS